MLGQDAQPIATPAVPILDAQPVPLDLAPSVLSSGVNWVRATATDIDVSVGTWAFSLGHLLDAYAKWWVPALTLFVILFATRHLIRVFRTPQRPGLMYCRRCNFELDEQSLKMCPECGPQRRGPRPVRGRAYLKRTYGWYAALLCMSLLTINWRFSGRTTQQGLFRHLPLHSRWLAKQIDENWARLPEWTQQIASNACSTQTEFVRLTKRSTQKTLFQLRSAVTWEALSPDGYELRFAQRGPGLLYTLYSARHGETPTPGPPAMLGGWLSPNGVWHLPSGHVAMFESPQSMRGGLGFTWSGDSQPPVPLPPLQHYELVTLDAAGDNIALAFSYAKNATEPCIVHVISIAGTLTQLEVDASLSTSASCFAASVDGALIAFVTQRELVRASVDLREGGRVQPKDRIALAKGVVPQHHVLSRDGRLSAIMTKAGEIVVFDWQKRALIGQSPVLKYRNATEARNSDLRESGDLAISADLKRLYVVLNTYTVPPVRWQDTQNVWQLYSIELPSLE